MTAFRVSLLCVALVLPIAAAQRAPKKDPSRGAPPPQPITVYRTASCGCCGKWVDHLKAAGFDPTVHMVQNTSEAPPARTVPAELRSCHTASLEGYTVEGHVPADIIRKLLRERPRIAGIAVPGMPAGSPGMESPNPQPYNVIAFDAAGKTGIFARK
jgi:hypothetical protein